MATSRPFFMVLGLVISCALICCAGETRPHSVFSLVDLATAPKEERDGTSTTERASAAKDVISIPIGKTSSKKSTTGNPPRTKNTPRPASKGLKSTQETGGRTTDHALHFVTPQTVPFSSRVKVDVTAMETTTQPNFQVVVPSGDIPHPYSVLRSTLQTSGIILPYYTRLVMHAVSVCQQNPHAIFVDVGSPFCFNTLLAASKGCRVMSVHEQPFNALLCEESLRINGWNHQVIESLPPEKRTFDHVKTQLASVPLVLSLSVMGSSFFTSELLDTFSSSEYDVRHLVMDPAVLPEFAKAGLRQWLSDQLNQTIPRPYSVRGHVVLPLYSPPTPRLQIMRDASFFQLQNQPMWRLSSPMPPLRMQPDLLKPEVYTMVTPIWLERGITGAADHSIGPECLHSALSSFHTRGSAIGFSSFSHFTSLVEPSSIERESTIVKSLPSYNPLNTTTWEKWVVDVKEFEDDVAAKALLNFRADIIYVIPSGPLPTDPLTEEAKEYFKELESGFMYSYVTGGLEYSHLSRSARRCVFQNGVGSVGRGPVRMKDGNEATQALQIIGALRHMISKGYESGIIVPQRLKLRSYFGMRLTRPMKEIAKHDYDIVILGPTDMHRTLLTRTVKELFGLRVTDIETRESGFVVTGDSFYITRRAALLVLNSLPLFYAFPLHLSAIICMHDLKVAYTSMQPEMYALEETGERPPKVMTAEDIVLNHFSNVFMPYCVAPFANVTKPKNGMDPRSYYEGYYENQLPVGEVAARML